MNEPVVTTKQPAAEELLAIVQQLAEETHPGHPANVHLHSSLERDLGLDSLARVELMLRIGKRFGMELPTEALAEADTPAALLRLLGQTPEHPAQTDGAMLAGMQNARWPLQATSLLDVLEWHATEQAERVHILLHDEKHREHPVSYGELLQHARGIAAGLMARGLQPRETVALMLPTGRDYLACFFGVLIAGGIPVPIYPPARMAQIEEHLTRHRRILANAQAVLIITFEQAKPVAVMLQAAVPSLKALVTPAELQAPPAQLHFRPQASDIAFIQYTSGSTGDPKGVALTHANLLANIRALGQATQAHSGDVFVSWLPLYHDMGLIGAWFGSMYHGIPLVLMSPLTFLSRPALWLQAITRHRATMSAAPNFAYELCTRHVSDAALRELDLTSWRLALNGAEPVSPATLEAFAARFSACGMRRDALTPVYGLAECSVGLAFPPLARGPRIDVIQRDTFARQRIATPASDAKENALSVPSCGRALPGHEIRIVGEDGDELPERHVGRLEFRGPSATTGYYRNPQATARLFHNGWLDSGDFAYMADGEVFVTGREKDLIKRGGRNLYPYDLEQAAGDIPGIRKGCVAAFASPDPATGTERLVVMAETREQDESRRAQLRQAITQVAVDVAGMPPDDIVLVPPHSVLKTSSGKIRRLASREAYEQGHAAEQPSAPRLHAARLAAQVALARAKVVARRAGAWLYGAYAWTVIALLALPCSALILLAPHPPYARRVARCGARLLLRLCAVPFSVTGIDRLPKAPHILLVNHASYLDAIFLTAALPASPGYAFAVKGEFERQPLMRMLLRRLGAIFIERADARKSAGDVETMAAALHTGDNLVVFPEGTFTREAGLRSFHSGAFAAAAKAGSPLVVAGLRGTRSAMRSGSWRPRRATVSFDIGAVHPPPGQEWRNIVFASASARATMAQLSGEFAWPE